MAQYDPDSSGALSFDQFLQMAIQGPFKFTWSHNLRLASKMAVYAAGQATLHEADKVCTSEVCTIHRTTVDQFDTNHSGMLSADELVSVLRDYCCSIGLGRSIKQI